MAAGWKSSLRMWKDEASRAEAPLFNAPT